MIQSGTFEQQRILSTVLHSAGVLYVCCRCAAQPVKVFQQGKVKCRNFLSGGSYQVSSAKSSEDTLHNTFIKEMERLRHRS